jgi:hypothetical protein
MAWFRRDGEPVAPLPEPTAAEDADMLRTRLSECYGFVNGNAGRLPADLVLTALHICDLLRETMNSEARPELDVHTVVSVERMLADYLPTTLRAYLAVGESGAAPLREQLVELVAAATDIQSAARQRENDAMLTHGAFLRTKFAGSDLDLC